VVRIRADSALASRSDCAHPVPQDGRSEPIFFATGISLRSTRAAARVGPRLVAGLASWDAIVFPLVPAGASFQQLVFLPSFRWQA
jgi:hypothetical protein